MTDVASIMKRLQHGGVKAYCGTDGVVDTGRLMVVPDHALRLVDPNNAYVRIGDTIAFVPQDLAGRPSVGVYCHAKVQQVQKANGRFRLVMDRASREFYEIKMVDPTHH